VFQEESAILWEKVYQVNLHLYKQINVHAKMEGYGDNDATKMRSFLQFYLLYLFNVLIIRTLRRSVAEQTATPRHTEPSVLCKALATPRTTFIKIVRTFLLNSCLYVINMLIKCHVQMLTLKKLKYLFVSICT
jgi:hypothetical protein